MVRYERNALGFMHMQRSLNTASAHYGCPALLCVLPYMARCLQSWTGPLMNEAFGAPKNAWANATLGAHPSQSAPVALDT